MNTMSAEEYRRMIAGARSRIAGQTFEDQITASLVWHEERGILKAAKTPEPMKPIGPKQKGGRFTAVYVKAAQVDFSGTMRGGRSVRFEAKQTDTDRFERKRLTDEQMDDLRGHEKLGALCFVICCFGTYYGVLVFGTLLPGPVEDLGQHEGHLRAAIRHRGRSAGIPDPVHGRRHQDPERDRET